jgi:hypothetical protein
MTLADGEMQMVAAAEATRSHDINGLVYPTAPESHSARKSKFSKLPNNKPRPPP